jgi:hypothetical protein
VAIGMTTSSPFFAVVSEERSTQKHGLSDLPSHPSLFLPEARNRLESSSLID